MSWQIVWTRPAVQDLTKRLDRQTAERVRLKMKRFAEAGIGNVERLMRHAHDPEEAIIRASGIWRRCRMGMYLDPFFH